MLASRNAKDVIEFFERALLGLWEPEETNRVLVIRAPAKYMWLTYIMMRATTLSPA